ncbi:YwdI family protein [Bacillus sp. FJAT-27445]|uniref:YwdI family protein n=1 Tax=Bacillus sp. FJAT-27445 TaxID=1679166 RepID=UPI0007436756|nr:YwdI family protein [Bacillus sp. FJAT-27445]
MNIHIETLLAKISEELGLAKGAVKEEELREKVYSIKTLCEVILTERETPVPKERQALGVQAFPAGGPRAIPSQGQKLELKDEANGDSIFDF